MLRPMGAMSPVVTDFAPAASTWFSGSLAMRRQKMFFAPARGAHHGQYVVRVGQNGDAVLPDGVENGDRSSER